MVYRVCKAFEVESGHMLSKHPGLCRHPHGHTRRVEVVLASPGLDAHDMVCDFKAVKLAVAGLLAGYDHAMAINSDDPRRAAMAAAGDRLVVFERLDPTTEVLARAIFDHLRAEVAAGREYRDEQGVTYRFPPGLRVERVRVSETSTTWAEFGA